jgi:hypothetical protein
MSDDKKKAKKSGKGKHDGKRPARGVADAASLQAAFAKMAPLARDVDPRDVKPLESDVEAVYHAVLSGLSAVVAHETRVRTELPLARVDDLRELPELSLALLEAVREAEDAAGGKRKRKKKAGADDGAPSAAELAAETRDRLWTLLKQRHEALWRVGAYLFGRAVDERIPALPAGKRKRDKKKRG